MKQENSQNMSSKAKKSTKSATKSAKKSSATAEPTKLKDDIRAIPIEEWDWSRLVYYDPVKSEIPDGSGSYRRVKIQYMYDDETIGPAIVELGKHYCFGVQPDNTDKDGKVQKDKNTGLPKPLRGYRVPIVMTSQTKNEPDLITDSEQAEVDFLDACREEVIRYSFENKKAIGKGGKKSEAEIEAIVGKLLYRKGESEGEVDPAVSPKFYANLIYYTNNKEVGTRFYGPGDAEVNPLKMTGHFYIYATIRLDSIYIGSKISLQHKIYDATVEPIARKPKKRLARFNSMPAADTAGEDEEEVALGDNEDPNEMMESEEED